MEPTEKKDTKDYKAICENLSKRIGRLHTVADNLMGRSDCPLGRDIDLHVLGRKLKNIAFGQP